MNNSTPKIGYWIAAAIVAIMVLAFCVVKCKPEPTPTPAPEQQRLTKEQEKRIREAAYFERDNYYQPILKAQDREIARLTFKDKQATEKARNSAATFVKTPTLDNCKEALVDCQDEVATKSAVIISQAQRIDSAKAQRVNDSTEILASHKAAEDFNKGWQQANLDNAEKDRKIKNKNKLLKILGAAVAVLVGVVAVK